MQAVCVAACVYVLAMSSTATLGRSQDRHGYASPTPLSLMGRDYTPRLCEGNTPHVFTHLNGSFHSPGYNISHSGASPSFMKPCLTNPCVNGGRCASRYDTPHCACPSGYYGNLCELSSGLGDPYDQTPSTSPNPNQSSCHHMLCYNGGSCAGTRNGYVYCACRDGYYGTMCQYTVHQDAEYDVAPFCIHSTAYDLDEEGRWWCECYLPHVGRWCQMYYRQYPNNAMCGWRIDVPSEYAIQLDLFDLDIERVAECTADSIRVYDAAQGRQLIQAPLCGTHDHVPIQTNSSHVLVNLVTDGSVTGRGFHATYTAVYVEQAGPSSTGQPRDTETPHNLDEQVGADKLCYQCEYVKDSNVEAGRDCKDPVVHHSIVTVPCTGLCYIIRVSTPNDGVEMIERGCSDHTQRQMCYDTNYDRDGDVYDESCCGTTLCNRGVLHPGAGGASADVGGASAGGVATISLVLLPCAYMVSYILLWA